MSTRSFSRRATSCAPPSSATPFSPHRSQTQTTTTRSQTTDGTSARSSVTFYPSRQRTPHALSPSSASSLSSKTVCPTMRRLFSSRTPLPIPRSLPDLRAQEAALDNPAHILRPGGGAAYQDELIAILQDRGREGSVPPHGTWFIELWREFATRETRCLRRAWFEIKACGEDELWSTDETFVLCSCCMISISLLVSLKIPTRISTGRDGGATLAVIPKQSLLQRLTQGLMTKR
ncbi:hypothetical protein EDB87DRAFT_65190 [Lactarius vividus]|nr:hypothetical protein EDB87DRAFT_65190 [Lactarius vividus]